MEALLKDPNLIWSRLSQKSSASHFRFPVFLRFRNRASEKKKDFELDLWASLDLGSYFTLQVTK